MGNLAGHNVTTTICAHFAKALENVSRINRACAGLVLREPHLSRYHHSAVLLQATWMPSLETGLENGCLSGEQNAVTKLKE